MFYQQAFNFSRFCQIYCFSEKKLSELLLLRFVWKDIRGWGRNSSKVQMLQIYLLQNTFLTLQNALAILRVKKKTFFLSQLYWSIGTKLRTLPGYTFPNISKIISLFLPPQFHHKFREGYWGQWRFDSWQLFYIKKCYIKCHKETCIIFK